MKQINHHKFKTSSIYFLMIPIMGSELHPCKRKNEVYFLHYINKLSDIINTCAIFLRNRYMIFVIFNEKMEFSYLFLIYNYVVIVL